MRIQVVLREHAQQVTDVVIEKRIEQIPRYLQAEVEAGTLFHLKDFLDFTQL